MAHYELVPRTAMCRPFRLVLSVIHKRSARFSIRFGSFCLERLHCVPPAAGEALSSSPAADR